MSKGEVGVRYFTEIINEQHLRVTMSNKMIICDLHCDTITELLAGADLKSSLTQVNIPAMKAGAVGIQLFACYVPPSIPQGSRFDLVMKARDVFEDLLHRYGDEIELARNVPDVRRIMATDKICGILTIENGNAIENNLKNLSTYYEMGVRCMTIVHAESHEWAISSNDSNPVHEPLTNFGEKVIAAMNEMGMIIDLSHAHDETAKRVLELSKRPVVATHSCVKKLCQHPRNLSDYLIESIADSGGMIGINFFPGFISHDYHHSVTIRAGELFSELSRMERQAAPDLKEIALLFRDFRVKIHDLMQDIEVTIDDVIDHIDYIVRLVGDDCIGFGSDFDGIPDAPKGLTNCADTILILNRMAERGYNEKSIEKIAYKNFLRVLDSHE